MTIAKSKHQAFCLFDTRQKTKEASRSRLRFAIAALHFAVATVQVAPLQAQESYNQVCNQTGLTVVFVNAFRSEDSNKWTTRHVVNLAPGACANAYKRRTEPWTAYYLAFGIGKKGLSKSAVWSGQGRANQGPLLCVFPFELSKWEISNQIDSNSSSCKKGEKEGFLVSMERFIKQSIMPNTTIQINLSQASMQF